MDPGARQVTIHEADEHRSARRHRVVGPQEEKPPLRPHGMDHLFRCHGVESTGIV